ncbi:dephospho-kinase [Micractinium conductrix]|uniref:Dephospho-kinase n=1 Tax=Micractinium conductrix TaxID=554055 RepID=A0A2P6VHA9_9CHLO|nr:dephospho-kinase [Micractinium conductrix]|eukprot:PSC73458.1 dephospho-kinase [Micractinium conductrix]
MSPSAPFVLGLTGGIAMGKSTVAGWLRELGVPVLDSDQVVHDLYASGGAAVGPVGAAFPGVVVDGAISRPELSKQVVGKPEALARLEALVHPLVTAEKRRWLAAQAAAGQPLVVLDIPLLYETDAQAQCDAVAVVSAPAEQQRARALGRPGMSEGKLEAILARQVPDAEKRKQADFVIDTGVPLAETRQHVVSMVEGLRGRQGGKYASLMAAATDAASSGDAAGSSGSDGRQGS